MRTDFHAALAKPYEWGEHITLRALDFERDIPLLHHWFTQDYAAFWNMQDHTEAQVREFYEDLVACGHAGACMGLVDGSPAFLVECYDPAFDELAGHYPVRPGDVGMHFFVGPARERIHGYTRRVFRALMSFIFERLQARRVVVEPDARNHKVHLLNRDMGFVEERHVRLTRKLALLSFCAREQFINAQARIHTEEEYAE
jgi:RimJ/RimL family protein N-acetyltransferase